MVKAAEQEEERLDRRRLTFSISNPMATFNDPMDIDILHEYNTIDAYATFGPRSLLDPVLPLVY
jgi:hypothetical protein